MFRTHTCGELRPENIGQMVKLCGWVSKIRDKGSIVWIDLRDRYGITQLVMEEGINPAETLETARACGREFVLQAYGEVIERYAKSDKLATGHIEVRVLNLSILNQAKIPPFLIEDETDGGDDLRLRYRYLDLRRNPVKDNLMLRHKMAQLTRAYLDAQGFIEVETPVLIKSTPEGARDFVVPSRMNPGQFYALPQSPQTFKQLLMVAGFDKYFQIVKCFRDEDLRADRQPEFTQIDCEMAFVEREDILNTFEGLTKNLISGLKGIHLADFPRITYAEAMTRFGNDKPDIRFGMELKYLKTNQNDRYAPKQLDLTSDAGFAIFEQAEMVGAIVLENGNDYTRKQLDELTDWVKRPQIGMKGLVYVRIGHDGEPKSSVDKFYNATRLKEWAQQCAAKNGDLILILAGETNVCRKALSELRLALASKLGLRLKDTFAPLWVLDFPLLEWDNDNQRWAAMHHPFTSPRPEHIHLLASNPGLADANAYDLVLNGNEIGGGSIRIHDRQLQAQLFKILGFSDEQAKAQFGFLMDAFEYGAPPHGGIAFGFDRLCAILGGSESIRDFIAFPKNNAGRDMMIDAPALLEEAQLTELSLKIR